mgnify:CR=1 FL=1
MAPSASVSRLADVGSADLGRRLTYLTAFRVLLITLVLGATTLLYWLTDVDLSQPGSLILYGIIGTTYLLTLVYAKLLGSTDDYQRLAMWQVVGDLVIATLIVHITGGVQSAYTFFFPLALIGSAMVQSRRGAVVVAIAATLLFVLVSYLGWSGILPSPASQRFIPGDLSGLEFGRGIALNLAAIAGVGAMAAQLAAQLQKSTADLEVHRSVAADLLTLHENIVRCLTSGLITVDVDTQVLTINAAASEILKRTPENCIGKNLIDCSAQLAQLLGEHPVEEEARRGEIMHCGPDGAEVILGVSISPLRDHTQRVVGRIINFQDLTEVRKLEEQIKRAERLTVVGTLAAGIAHEIRNPLASISGSVEHLSLAPEVDEDSGALMSIVTREIDRLDALISDLLAYASPRALNTTELDLCAIIRETLRVFAQDTEFGDLDAKFEEDESSSLSVEADPGLDRKVSVSSDCLKSDSIWVNSMIS